MKKIIANNLFLFKKVNEYSPSYLAVVLFVSLTAFVGPLTTTLIPKLIMDSLLNKQPVGQVFTYVIFAAAATGIRVLVKALFNEVYVPYNRNNIQRGMNALLMEKSQKLDLRCLDDPEFYNKYTRALEQADSGLLSFVDNTASFFDRFVYISTVITIISTLDPVLIVFSVASVITLFFFGKKTSAYRYNTTKKTTPVSRQADYSKRIHYLPEYAKETRTSNIGALLLDNYIQANKQNQGIVKKRSLGITALTLSDEGLRTLVMQLGVMFYLVFQISSGSMEVSSFLVLYLATMQMSFEFFSFVNCVNNFYRLSLHTDDLAYILNYKSEIEKTDSGETGKILNEFESISIKNINFSYNNQTLVLDDVSLDIAKGEHTALVGYNGAGKTTLIKLIMRLYDPARGGIFVNGINLKEYNVRSYRDRIGVVYQDYRCYALTIAENVLLKKVVTDEERNRVTEALKKSGLYDDISAFPKGIDTVLTREFDDEGVVLSGGQSQKLALTRVFVHADKQILILDEASSAMDPLSEAAMNNNILDFCKDKTLILISHRLSVTKNMDNIYVISGGKIAERGTHTQLMDQGGIYAKMYKVQSANYL
jgi:ATP-binding cassette subfamily B protein